jgi:hypothetical protein
MRSWHRGVLAALVLVAFCGSAWATCAEGAIASKTEQMSCCMAGHEHCPMKDSASDCCQKSGPQVEHQATLVKATATPAPVRIVLTWVTVSAFALTLPAQPHVSLDSSPPTSQVSPPVYILFSTLLI